MTHCVLDHGSRSLPDLERDLGQVMEHGFQEVYSLSQPTYIDFMKTFTRQQHLLTSTLRYITWHCTVRVRVVYVRRLAIRFQDYENSLTLTLILTL